MTLNPYHRTINDSGLAEAKRKQSPFLMGAFGGLVYSTMTVVCMIAFITAYTGRQPPFVVVWHVALRIILTWTLIAGFVGLIRFRQSPSSADSKGQTP